MKTIAALALACATILPPTHSHGASAHPIRAGAAIVSIDPEHRPVIVNAMFTERSADQVIDPLKVRALVVESNGQRIAIAAVDSCMVPRDLLDQAKDLAHTRTGIPVDRMLISATHTHSAPSAMGCLGSRVDPRYAAFLPSRIAAAIVEAAGRLEPARVGSGSADGAGLTHNRRWIRRSDRLLTDPFGFKTVRAHMHPGHQSPDAIGPSGPVDPEITFLTLQAPDGRTIALLSNFSMHYYESALLSSDYFGKYSDLLESRLHKGRTGAAPVVIMTQGTSGDLMWMDYGAPPNKIGYQAYAQQVADRVEKALANVTLHSEAPIAMAEAKLTLGFRLATPERLVWAREMTNKMAGRIPQNLPEVYAHEQIYLHNRPTAELKLQALRIGDLAITAIPNEVFAITGLKLKAQSPLPRTMNIELANGAEGYIPPPEQHRLGGYTTWAARTAGLETNAEPKIVETLVGLIEKVGGQPRRPLPAPVSPLHAALQRSKPDAYWRLNELSGAVAADASRHKRHARLEGLMAFQLDGAVAPERAIHFVDGYLESDLPAAREFSVELWFWNGMPTDALGVTGGLLRLENPRNGHAVTLSLGGTNFAPARLILESGNLLKVSGSGATPIPVKTWRHLTLTYKRDRVQVYLNGLDHPEIDATLQDTRLNGPLRLRIGHTGQGLNGTPWQGRVDEVAWYRRVLSLAERREHAQAR